MENDNKNFIIANISITILFWITAFILYTYDIPIYEYNNSSKIEIIRDLFLYHYNRELKINQSWERACLSKSPSN